jgi:hypothetical protein
MELKFTPVRIGVLVALLVGYAFWGGFMIPGELSTPALRRWAPVPLLFVAGAVAATVIDQRIGMLDRLSIRWFYVVIGVAAMAMAATLDHLFRSP